MSAQFVCLGVTLGIVYVLLCCLQFGAVSGGTLRFNAFQDYGVCYAITFDAGSSGSRVYLYEWECRTQKTIPHLFVNETVRNMNQRPGISSFAMNPTAAGPSLIPLLNYSLNGVPDNQEAFTPLYLRATAGMRLLTAAQQEAIYSSIRATFRTTPFRFENSDWVKTITGQEEGAFLWVAANYLYKRLSSSIPPTQTRAVLDCGGASLQLAFIPSSPPTDSLFSVTFGESSLPQYDLYSYSWLGYGNDQARNSVIKLSINDTSKIVYSPCINVGYRNNASFDPSLIVIGTGDPAQCITLIRQFFNMSASCSSSSTCSINGIYRPVIQAGINITAVSSFRYAGQVFSSLSGYTPNQLSSLSNAFCRLSFQQVKANYSSLLNPEFQCFQNLYVKELLTYAFGIAGDRYIDTTSDVGAVSIGWSLGSVLFDVGQLACKANTENCLSTGASLPSLKALFLLLLFVVFQVVSFRYE